MKTAEKSKVIVIIIVALILIFAAILIIKSLSSVIKRSEEPADPHAGQVYVNDGFKWVWITPVEGVESSPFTEKEFSQTSGQPEYTGQQYDTVRGIDVSEHQLEIDWKQVADSGVEFAFIRVGYRGTTQGGLFDDEYYKANIQGALDNGLKVGVYMFSQAINVSEAIEEANYIMERIKNYDIELPIMFDWEKEDGYRTDALDYLVMNDCAVAFCQTVENAGYTAGIYFNKQLGYYGFDLSRMTDYTFWVTDPGEFPDFYYSQNIWQYSFTETVPGIETETDMNLMFIPRAAVQATPTA